MNAMITKLQNNIIINIMKNSIFREIKSRSLLRVFI